MLTRLNDGDVILQCGTKSRFFTENPSKEPANTIMQTAAHAMIYEKGRLYHSTFGQFQAGVKSHTISHVIKIKGINNSSTPSQEDDYDEAELCVGDYAVLHCKNEKLRELFTEIVKRWDVKLTPEQLSRQPTDEYGKIKLFTPFTDFFSRDADPEHRILQELYRAFRAYQRSQAHPIQPLSKDKGVSCSSFLAYSFKAAIIKYLFPDGLPSNIEKKLAEIEGLKKSRGKTKLSQLDYTHFQEFSQLVKSLLPAESQKQLLRILNTPVKGKNVKDFCEFATKFPEIWEFKGYVFFLSKQQQSQDSSFYVMDYPTYQKLLDQHGTQPHSIVISEEEMQSLQSSRELTAGVQKTDPKV